jgi:hypothetical protein
MVVERLSASGERIRRSGIFSVNTFNSKGRYKWDGANTVSGVSRGQTVFMNRSTLIHLKIVSKI